MAMSFALQEPMYQETASCHSRRMHLSTMGSRRYFELENVTNLSEDQSFTSIHVKVKRIDRVASRLLTEERHVCYWCFFAKVLCVTLSWGHRLWTCVSWLPRPNSFCFSRSVNGSNLTWYHVAVSRQSCFLRAKRRVQPRSWPSSLIFAQDQLVEWSYGMFESACAGLVWMNNVSILSRDAVKRDVEHVLETAARSTTREHIGQGHPRKGLTSVSLRVSTRTHTSPETHTDTDTEGVKKARKRRVERTSWRPNTQTRHTHVAS